MEYETQLQNDSYQQEKSRKSARPREMSLYEAAKGLSKPIGLGMYIPGINVHIIPPQEFKGLVQRLTGAPQYRKESRPRSIASPRTDTAPSYQTENSEHYQHLHRLSMPSYDQHASPSTPINYEHAENYYSTTYEQMQHSPYVMQSPVPHSPQPFAAMDLPPLSPSDQIWADGWR